VVSAQVQRPRPLALTCSTTSVSRGLPAEHIGGDPSGAAIRHVRHFDAGMDAWNFSFSNCVCDRIESVA